MPDLDSTALSLFLRYVHHHRQPDLSNVPFTTLRDLAEAVEKYDVYSATEICKTQMWWGCCRFLLSFLLIGAFSLSVKDHCVEVFHYAVKHGYRKLMDDAGLIAVQNKHWSQQVPNGLYHRPDIQAAWVRVFSVLVPPGLTYVIQCQYQKHWFNLFVDCYDDPPPVLHRGGTEDCKMWRKFRNVVVSQVKREVAIFSSFGSIVDETKHYLKDCRHCCIRADSWTKRVQRHIWEVNPKLTSFL
jgi:hypothetical protein